MPLRSLFIVAQRFGCFSIKRAICALAQIGCSNNCENRIFRKRFVKPVALPLRGARSGSVTGPMLNIALNVVGAIKQQ